MAITQSTCVSFMSELFSAIHDFSSDTFKLALYTSAATLGPDTTVYSATNEIGDTGTYFAGGLTLSGTTVATSGTTITLTFSNVSATSATIIARGALIYNASKANRAVLVLDFGSDKSDTAGTFTITFPTTGADSALFRLTKE